MPFNKTALQKYSFILKRQNNFSIFCPKSSLWRKISSKLTSWKTARKSARSLVR